MSSTYNAYLIHLYYHGGTIPQTDTECLFCRRDIERVDRVLSDLVDDAPFEVFNTVTLSHKRIPFVVRWRSFYLRRGKWARRLLPKWRVYVERKAPKNGTDKGTV